jgi:hypothetical protein
MKPAMAEKTDHSDSSYIDTGKLRLTGVIVLGVLALILAGLYGAYIWLAGANLAPPPAGRLTTHQIDLQPHLQTHPQSDLETLRRHKQAVLESYGWVDRDKGIAHIPITRAMALMAERKQGETGQ